MREQLIQEAMRQAGVTDPSRLTQGDLVRVTQAYEELRDEQGTSQQVGPTAEEPWRKPLNVDERSLAVEVLMETGLDRKQANEVLALGGISDGLREKIAEKRAFHQERFDHENKIAWQQSPEGRKAAAESALAAQTERSGLAESARALLLAEGHEAEDVQTMDTDQVIRAAGLETNPKVEKFLEGADDLQANIAAAEAGDPTPPTTD